MKFGNFFEPYLLFITITDIILYSAFTLFLVAVVAITAEARHVKKTPPQGSAYAKILSLVEKIKENLSTCPDGRRKCGLHPYGECCPPPGYPDNTYCCTPVCVQISGYCSTEEDCPYIDDRPY